MNEPPNSPKTAQPVGVTHHMVTADEAGRRLDNFLLSRLKGVPKSRIYRLLRKGEVRVNKKRVKADYRLGEGDDVRIPPVRIAENGAKIDPSQRVLKSVSERIVFEDEGLIVLDKPSGLAVHGGSGLSYGAIEALRSLYPNERFLELVHRLDRETSGLLLIARKRALLRHLHDEIRNHRLGKRYLALLKGKWRGGAKTVNAPLLTSQRRGGERTVEVHPDGKESISHFRPVRSFEEATLVQVSIETGRTHQIRVHAQHLGMPVAGDDRYGHQGFNLRMKGQGLGRLFLVAAELDVPMPDDKTKRFRIELDAGLNRVIQGLK